MSKELSKEHKKYQLIDILDTHMSKLKGYPLPGREVTIQWNDGVMDDGYLFTIPECDETIDYDMFVHVPKPDNSSGIGDAPEVWQHLNNLLTNDFVDKIIVK